MKKVFEWICNWYYLSCTLLHTYFWKFLSFFGFMHFGFLSKPYQMCFWHVMLHFIYKSIPLIERIYSKTPKTETVCPGQQVSCTLPSVTAGHCIFQIHAIFFSFLKSFSMISREKFCVKFFYIFAHLLSLLLIKPYLWSFCCFCSMHMSCFYVS